MRRSSNVNSHRQFSPFFTYREMNRRDLVKTPRPDAIVSPLSTCAEGLRGWEFCTICPFFANFSTFTKIPQVPSFQAHSPVKTVFPKNAKNARKSQNTPSTKPYQNETQFSPISLKSRSSRHPRQPKSVICPPVISGKNSRASSLKSAKFRHGTAGLSNVEVSPIGGRGKPFTVSFPKPVISPPNGRFSPSPVGVVGRLLEGLRQPQ